MKLTKLKLPDASLALAPSYPPSFLLLQTHSFFCTKLYTLLRSPQIFTGFRPHSAGAHPQVALFFPSGNNGRGGSGGGEAKQLSSIQAASDENVEEHQTPCCCKHEAFEH